MSLLNDPAFSIMALAVLGACVLNVLALRGAEKEKHKLQTEIGSHRDAANNRDGQNTVLREQVAKLEKELTKLRGHKA